MNSRLPGIWMLIFLFGAGLVSAEEAPAPVESLTLEVLMGHFASTSGVVATYTESKELALLMDPIVSEGTLYFIPPNRMARYTHSPGKSALIIDGKMLKFIDELGGEEIDLSSHAEARQLVDHMIVLFNGDLAAMKKKYSLEFSSDQSTWTLLIRPKTFPAKSIIESIELQGNGQALQTMLLLETDGDRTLTEFKETQVDHVFSPEELSRVFPAPSPETAPET